MQFGRKAHRTVALGVVACLVLTMSGGLALAADKYGAIAYSPDTHAYGWSYKQSTRDEAEVLASNKCDENAVDCRVVTWFRNGCGALARGSSGWGAAGGDDRATAARKAMNLCSASTSGCKVIRWVCTGVD